MTDAPVQAVAFSAEAHPMMTAAMKMQALVCMIMDRVCEGNTRHTGMTDKGGAV